MSGGTWSMADVNSPSTRPGAYFNLIAQAISLVPPGERGTVAVVGRADWGPVGEFVSIVAEEDFGRVFGTGQTLSRLGRQAIRGGADEVVALRVAGASAAAAEATLMDDADASALTLTARYPGLRGNDFTVTVEDNPAGGQNLLVFEGDVLVEQHTFSGTNNEWADYLNESSTVLVASVPDAEDLTLDAVTGTSFTGGDSGEDAAADDYVTAQVAAGQQDFDVYVQDDEGDDAAQDAIIAWAEERREGGQYFMTVIGSEEDAELSDAIARAEAIDSIGIAYVFPGFTDADGQFYSGADAAARVAGLIASRGISRSVTFAPIEDAETVETRLTNEEVRSGLSAGLLLLTHDGEVVRVEKGINTFTTFSESAPRAFSKIRTVRTLDEVRAGLERGMRDMIGQVTNDDDGRASLVGAGQAFLDELIAARAIKPDAVLELDTVTPAEADHVFIKVGLTPLDSIEQIFTTIYLSA